VLIYLDGASYILNILVTVFPGPTPYHPYTYPGYPYAQPFLPPNPMSHPMFNPNFPGYLPQYVSSMENLMIPQGVAATTKPVVSPPQTLSQGGPGLFSL
jgi:hypothetical protein